MRPPRHGERAQHVLTHGLQGQCLAGKLRERDLAFTAGDGDRLAIRRPGAVEHVVIESRLRAGHQRE